MTIPLASLPVETSNPVIDQLNLRFEIIHHMAKAFFACAWADWKDKYDDGFGPGVEIMNVMPDEIDPGALKAAYALAAQLEKETKADLTTLLRESQEQVAECDHYLPCDAEHFGHYVAMQAMGHGVGLTELGLDHEWIDVPDIEFSYYELDPEKYPMPEDDED